MKKKNVFVISAPSGTGKSSLVREICNRDKTIARSISYTTREKRNSENANIDYYFINTNEFIKMINNNEFLEYAEVYNYHYGTGLKKTIESTSDIILTIDWQGAKQIKKKIPTAILIYILPPSLQELEQRVFNRNQHESIREIQLNKTRLNDFHNEILHLQYFDYAIINNDFNEAVQNILTIIYSQRLKLSKMMVKQLINKYKE